MTRRDDLATLDGQTFDTVVIGGGINGASSAQHLAAAGYRVLLAEKGDYASGSSSRSTRILHCGLRYFETPRPLRDFGLSPSKLRDSLAMARQAMEMRGELIHTASKRLRPFTMLFPVHRDGAYPGWQVDLAFRLLGRYGPRDVPLNYRRHRAGEYDDLPFVAEMREREKLTSVAAFTEYLYDWPERFTIDALMDARRMGAEVRNHTAVTGLEHRDGAWSVTLTDETGTATVTAPTVLNMAGIWIDRVGALAGSRKRRIYGTKGAHVVVQLPPAFRDHGVATVNSVGEPHYCVPSQGGFHHIGPTETPYDGDPDDIHVTPDERDFLLEENRLAMPGLKLGPEDVIYTWAGVRPLGYDPAYPRGKRVVEVHDAGDGMFALTGGPIMTHRTTGRALRDAVAGLVPPSGAAQEPDYTPRDPPENPNSPAFLDGDPSLRLADLAHFAVTEDAATLADIVIRRTGAIYRARLGADDLRRAAGAVSAHLGWDAVEVERQIADAQAVLSHFYGVD